MNKQAQQLSQLCKHISLRLAQGDRQALVQLVGDILPDDCLVLHSPEAFMVDGPAQLAVCFQQQSFLVAGEVRLCREEGDACLIHFRLHHPDKLQTRMLLQLSEIEQYRQYLLSRGREVTIDEAADEWVMRYAEDFAAEFDAEHQG